MQWSFPNILLLQIFKMKCQICDREFKDILKHLKKSVPCQDEDYMRQIELSRQHQRLNKKRNQNKASYDRNKSKISEVRAGHYMANKEAIRKSQANYYQEAKNLVAQRQRFAKHFEPKDAYRYLTSEQEHLYEHCRRVCQPSTMKKFNHSVEYYNGLCKFCDQYRGIKLLGVNRQVCIDCSKAQCTNCHTEVDPDPEFGCFHYSPDMGSLLGFMPDYCPLYSSRDRLVSNQLIVHDCRICSSVKEAYPEYEIFGDISSQYRIIDNSLRCRKIYVYMYTCNLCGSRFDHVCEFDLHMRSHTKYGKSIAIVGIDSEYEVGSLLNSRLDGEEFELLSDELIKIPAVSSILSVFNKKRLIEYSSLNDDIDIDLNLFASLHLKEGSNIEQDLESMSFEQNVIRKIIVLCVKSHFVTDSSTQCMLFEVSDYRRRSFESLLRWKDVPLLPCSGVPSDESWYIRNTALLTSRCSLQYPVDCYQALPAEPVTNFASHVHEFLWKRVKHSDQCCCVSKFFCTSSKNVDKCKNGCCGKCLEDDPESYSVEGNS